MEVNRDIVGSVTEAVREQLEKDKRILAVLLLGSATRGEMRPGSDIDLALMLEPGVKIDILERTQMAGALSYKLAQTVDLGDILSKNLVYAREALLTGIMLFCRNIEKYNLSRANLLGLYIVRAIAEKQYKSMIGFCRELGARVVVD